MARQLWGGLDTSIFITVAFIGTAFFVPIMILYHWLAKTLIEALATPLTYAMVNWVKKREAIDTYDYDTRFNPFLIAN